MVGYQDWVGMTVLKPAVPGAAARAANFTGAAQDMIEADDQHAIMLTGTATAVATITVEQSDDGSTNWAAVPLTVSALAVANQLPIAVPISATESIYAANFHRSKRFIRAIITGTGHSLAGVFVSRKKYDGD